MRNFNIYSTLLVISIILLILGCDNKNSPSSRYLQFKSACISNDIEKSYDMLSKDIKDGKLQYVIESTNAFFQNVDKYSDIKADATSLKEKIHWVDIKDTKETWAAILSRMNEDQNETTIYSDKIHINKCDEKGIYAIIIFDNNDKINMLKENDIWFIDEPRIIDDVVSKWQEDIKNSNIPNYLKMKNAEANRVIPTKYTEWTYKEEIDRMGRGNNKYAWIYSSTFLSFGFPYEGLQRAELTIRRVNGRNEVYIKIEEGQFQTDIYGTELTVRFDDGKPQHYSAVGSSDNDPTVLFINSYERFITNLKKARRLLIEATFYQEGNYIMEFDVENLEW